MGWPGAIRPKVSKASAMVVVVGRARRRRLPVKARFLTALEQVLATVAHVVDRTASRQIGLEPHQRVPDRLGQLRRAVGFGAGGSRAGWLQQRASASAAVRSIMASFRARSAEVESRGPAVRLTSVRRKGTATSHAADFIRLGVSPRMARQTPLMAMPPPASAVARCASARMAGRSNNAPMTRTTRISAEHAAKGQADRAVVEPQQGQRRQRQRAQSRPDRRRQREGRASSTASSASGATGPASRRSAARISVATSSISTSLFGQAPCSSEPGGAG